MPLAKSLVDAAKGLVFGALLGDTTGSFVEFEKSCKITEKRVVEAFLLNGGGAFRVGPAQYTDDGEMTVSSLIAFGEHTPGERFSLTPHVRWYKRWMESNPFDIGMTTHTGLEPLLKNEDAELCFNKAEAQSTRSESNGALMRATPLALFGHKLLLEHPDDFARLVTLDVHFTHSNELVHAAVISYAFAIATMLQPAAFGNRELAIEKTYNWLRSHESGRQLVKTAQGQSTLSNFFENYILNCPANDSDLADGSALGKGIDQSSQGWLMFAYTLAFRHLRRGKTWYEAIRDTIRLGGDTDTNACIVGGLIGCADGLDGLDATMLEKLRKMDPSKFNSDTGRRRPDYFAGKNIDGYIEKAIEKAPDRIEFGKVENRLFERCVARGLGYLYTA